MKGVTLLAAGAAAILGGSALADIVEIGTFANTGWGEYSYTGDFAQYISGEAQGDGTHYTVIHINLTELLGSIGEEAFISVSTIDTGENIYTTSPGADMDLFTFSGTSEGNGITYEYDGPTEWHHDETSEILQQRVGLLDWGTNGAGLGSMTYVSLGYEGVLTARFGDAQNRDPEGGDSPVMLHLSEVGSMESFIVTIETVPVPAPSALASLFAMGLIARRRRRK